MGRGSGTTQLGVKKPRAIHVIGDGGGVSSFSGEASSNVCLFSLNLNIKYPADSNPKVLRGDTVTLARVNADEIGVFVANRHISSYTGKQKARLLACMAQSYVYYGEVQSVGANTLRAIVKGRVLGHEAPSAT